jgi:hypothetical protein
MGLVEALLIFVGIKAGSFQLWFDKHYHWKGFPPMDRTRIRMDNPLIVFRRRGAPKAFSEGIISFFYGIEAGAADRALRSQGSGYSRQNAHRARRVAGTGQNFFQAVIW